MQIGQLLILADIRMVIDPQPAIRMNRGDKSIFRIPEHRLTKKVLDRRKVVRRYLDYKTTLKKLSLEHKYELTEELSVVFVMPMPKSWSRKKRIEMNGKPHQQKPDLDNLLKAFKDAMIDEDSFVHSYQRVSKIWGEQGQILIFKTQI